MLNDEEKTRLQIHDRILLISLLFLIVDVKYISMKIILTRISKLTVVFMVTFDGTVH